MGNGAGFFSSIYHRVKFDLLSRGKPQTEKDWRQLMHFFGDQWVELDFFLQIEFTILETKWDGWSYRGSERDFIVHRFTDYVNSSSQISEKSLADNVREIYSSLFDHKPAARREVEFFVKEFEESRKDREVDRLFKILERVTELKETELLKTQALGDIHLPKLAAELQVAESIANKLICKESNSNREITAKLEKERLDRVSEWDTFVHDMTTKCIRIDSNYKKKQEEVKDIYKKAGEKLFCREEDHTSK